MGTVLLDYFPLPPNYCCAFLFEFYHAKWHTSQVDTPNGKIWASVTQEKGYMYVQPSVGPGWASGRAFQLQKGGGAGGFSCAQRPSPPHSGRFSASASLQDKKRYVKTQNDATSLHMKKTWLFHAPHTLLYLNTLKLNSFYDSWFSNSWWHQIYQVQSSTPSFTSFGLWEHTEQHTKALKSQWERRWKKDGKKRQWQAWYVEL